jgi:hypothetical protein
MGWVLMSERDVQRIEVLTEVFSGRRTVASAAVVLAITSRKQRRSFHQPRLRRESYGELVQIDGSDHRWFEQRGDPLRPPDFTGTASFPPQWYIARTCELHSGSRVASV